MASSSIGPRSVKDATRFTSTMPHATSKSPPTGAAASAPASGASSSPIKSSMPPPSSRMSRLPGETPEQRVHRLRQAHLAAQRAQVSQTDRMISASRRFLDVAHRWTIGGIVLFTVGAGLISAYSVWDMLRYNRARRTEWTEAQKRLEADSLATARLAYLKGEATEAQVLLVEDANREAQAKGTKLPPLLAPPEHRTHFEETVKPAFQGDKAQVKGVLGALSGLFGGGAKVAKETAKTETHYDPSASATTGSIVKAMEDKAKSAWEREKENQRQGGSLDQLGLNTADTTQTSKSWRPW